MSTKNVAGFLICSVCCELYKKPKCLPCCHSYCEECLAKLQQGPNEDEGPNRRPNITCPECMRSSRVPAGGLRQFPNNFFINRMVEEVILREKVTGHKEVNCDLCIRSDPAIALCFDCGVLLCSHCHESHKYGREHQGHHMEELKELRRENKDVSIRLKPKPSVCPQHKLELNFYCETCEQLVCHYCITKNHFSHKHNTVKDVAAKHRAEMEEIIEPVDRLITTLLERHRKVTMTRERIEQQTIEAGKQINRYYRLLQRRLQQQRVNLIKELCEVSTWKQNILLSHLNEIEDVQTQVEDIKELSIAVKDASDQEALFMKKQIIEDSTMLTNHYKRSRSIESAHMQFIPVEKYHKWFPQFGNVFYGEACAINSEIKDFPSRVYINEYEEFEIVTKDADNKDCYEGGSKVIVEAESSAGDIIPVTVCDRENGTYSADFTVNQIGEVKISAIVEGKHIKESPSRVVVSRNYEKLDRFCEVVDDNGRMGQPWGIAFDKDGMWAVADHSNHCVYIFDGQDQLIRKFGSKGKGKGHFNSPTALAFDEDGHLYVVDRDNARVQKFNIEGKFLCVIGSHPFLSLFKGFSYGCDQFSYPLGITVHKDTVYVTDQGKQQVFLFNKCDGYLKGTMGKSALSEPYDIAVNINNQVLVADRGHRCIFVFHGSHVRRIGEEFLGKDRLNFPASITTDACGFILWSWRIVYISLTSMVLLNTPLVA